MKLTFYRKSTLNDILNDTLNDRILSILKTNSHIKQNELAQKLKVSLITVKRVIKKLSKEVVVKKRQFENFK